MKKPNTRTTRKLTTIIATSLLMFAATTSPGANGSWSMDADGNWSDTANWLGNIFADGVGNTAYFTNEITGIRTVTLDSARTVGNLYFSDGDSVGTPEAGWILVGSSTLTLSNSATTPVITVTNLQNASMLNDAKITAVINSGQGFIKRGTNTLNLTAANTFGAPIQVEGGLVGLGSATALGTNAVIMNGGGVAIVSGAYANTNNVTSVGSLVNLSGANYDNLNGPWIGSASATMNIYSGYRFTLNAGNAAQLSNFKGTISLSNSPSSCLLRINLGASSYDLSAITLDTGTGSGRFANRATTKAVWKIGALKGSGGQLCGSENAGGTMVTDEVGYLNTDTTFGGSIRSYGAGKEVALTKVGTGKLTLTGTSLYVGNTVISNGVLALSGSGSIATSPLITVMAGSKFDVSGLTAGSWSPAAAQTLAGAGAVTGNVAVAQGAIAPGVGGVGTLSFSNNLSLAGSYVTTNLFEVGAAGNDKIIVAGDLTVSEMVIVRVVPTAIVIPNGTYTLMKCSGTLTADLANMTLEYPAQTGTLTLGVNSGTKEIYLTVTGVSSAANLTWKGNLSPDWDFGTANWLNASAASVFATGDNVTFDSTSTATNVNIAIDAAPGAVVVNSTRDYVFDNGGGAGKITGMASLTKTNTGTLTLVTDNDYAGATVIQKGNVVVGDGVNYRGKLGTGPVTNNATVTYNRPDDLATASLFYGTGKLVKVGANTLTLSGVNNCAGGLTISNGIVAINSYGALSSNGVVLAGGQLTIYPAGGAASGLDGQVNVVDNSTILYASSGTYACVFTGPLTGTVGKMLTLTPTSTSTSRVRLYGTFTNNADLNLSASTMFLAPYNSSGFQVFNGVVSGSGAIIARCNGGQAILNNAGNIYSGGTMLSQGAIGVGADSVLSGGTIVSGPLGIGPIVSTTESGTSGSCTLLASGGARTIANPITYDVGANLTTIILGGTNSLTLSGAMSLNGNDGAINPRTIEVNNTALSTLSGLISDGGLTGSLIKTGNGTLVLSGVNAYTGVTTVGGGTLLVNGQIDVGGVAVTNGTLGGTGTILGAVTVSSGATLAPGASIGTLKIENSLVLQAGSTNAVEVQASGACDQVSGLTSVTYGGTLTVTNLSGTLTTNSTFKLFAATSYAGMFAAVTPAPGPGLDWNTNTLATDGTLRVKLGAPTTPPAFNSAAVTGGNLVFSGTNGTPGGSYSVLASTNAAAPRATWQVNTTGTFSATGTFTNSIPVDATKPVQFFLLRVP